MIESKAEFILIINPRHGDLKNNSFPLFENIVDNMLKDYDNYFLGYIVDAQSTLIDVEDFLEKKQNHKTALIHNGFPKAKELAFVTARHNSIKKHVYLDDQLLYRRHFRKDNADKVLIKDGFKKDVNKNYVEVESFSELHLTYEELGLDGFGDFLIVGDEYSETGGPAYAVAIHLTFLDNANDEEMWIYHFKSDSNSTPTNPAGKFAEAMKKLVNTVREDERVLKSEAYKQYKKLYEDGHFPGLGIVKKLSMQHHIETYADFLLR
jgi:hypothetical protein